MKHETNDKGDVGVAKIIADLIEKGYQTFEPTSSTCPFDLLVLVNNTFLRVQVKYRSISKTGTLDVSLRRAVITNSKISYSYNQDVDLLAIYCPETRMCYYIKSEDFNESISLRLDLPKNRQTKNIKFAKDYTQL